MPEKSLTIAAYAAGASLAAATLVYVFGPTFFLDKVDTLSRDHKRIAIGLSNPANDCFINAILQALAGLPTLRQYLIQELHQRQQDQKEVYTNLDRDEDDGKNDSKIDNKPPWLRLSLQAGNLTAALKQILDALNEQPLARKTISASPFISAVEQAFKTRVSRYQQDAQEFLQLILERLADEYQAGVLARRRASRRNAGFINAVSRTSDSNAAVGFQNPEMSEPKISASDKRQTKVLEDMARLEIDANQPSITSANSSTVGETTTESKLPFEGQLESRIECGTCHFEPNPSVTRFVTLTLNVPHAVGATTLDACLDGILKIEHIDDFRCDRCRLEHAQQLVARRLKKPGMAAQQRSALEKDLDLITKAIKEDPEHAPDGVQLPDAASAPKRKITRCMRISSFPTILTIHLSRSVWDGYSSSSKNLAKVAFTELLHLGSLLDRKTYRLLGMVTHKGGHNSGHYESFRRQVLRPMIDSARPSTSDDTAASRPATGIDHGTTLSDRQSPGEEEEQHSETTSTSVQAHDQSDAITSTKSSDAHPTTLKNVSQAKLADRKRKAQDRWWRISDEKVKECKLADVMGMQREVYLLFYELVQP